MRLFMLLFTVGYVLELCSGQKRLYYTGSFKNVEVNSVAFAANRLLHADIFQHNTKGQFVPDFNHSVLFSGQTFARLKHVNVSIDEELLNSLRSHITSDLSGFILLSAAFYKQISAYDYGMAMLSSTVDQTLLNDYVLEAEIGLYDHSIDQFLERYWREISGGDLIAMTASVKVDNHGVGATESAEVDVSVIPHHQQQHQQHKMTFTRDFMGRISALSHTWRSENKSNNNDNNNNDGSQSNQQCEASGVPADSVPLRVMTYNLWHNNPPSWVYHDQSARWKRYERRLQHFADVVAAEDPDVITLQEVRHDSAFTANSRKTRHWNDLAQEKDDAGAQVEHLLSHLASARRRLTVSRGGNSSAGRSAAADRNYYQYVSHPAMAMLERNRLIYRNEEGLLILSKLPIADSDVLFLPRNIGDASDDHQRIVLRVSVQLPLPAGCSSRDPVTVDVMTSHLSLSPTARDLAAAEIVHFASCPAAGTSGHVYRPSPIQVLTGDFNAEPHEPAVQYLLDPANYAAVKCTAVDDQSVGRTGSSSSISPAAFVDSWSEHSQRSDTTASPAVGAEMEIDATGSIVSADASLSSTAGGDPGFTFPSCNPVKRIDFVLVRNATAPADGGSGRRGPTATIANSYIAGTRPTKDTEHLVNSREGLGMNDRDSPIWASDHFAVVTDLLVNFQRDA